MAVTTADITARALLVTATGQDKVYDGTTAASVTFGDDRVAGDVLTASGTASFGDKNVGIGKTVTVSGIGLSGADAGNYTFNSTAVTTADITARALLVTATGQNKVYDGLAFAGGNGVTYAGFVMGENEAVLGGGVIYGGTSQGAVNAGTYSITVSGLTSANYAISYISGALVILPDGSPNGPDWQAFDHLLSKMTPATFVGPAPLGDRLAMCDAGEFSKTLNRSGAATVMDESEMAACASR